jgi:hypothetical protein
VNCTQKCITDCLLATELPTNTTPLEKFHVTGYENTSYAKVHAVFLKKKETSFLHNIAKHHEIHTKYLYNISQNMIRILKHFASFVW